jgi:hypothetical protein
MGGDNDSEETVMYLRAPSSSRQLPVRPIVDCAQCGERIYAAEWSEYIDACHARHLWSCDRCGYSFETLVKFPAVERPAA